MDITRKKTTTTRAGDIYSQITLKAKTLRETIMKFENEKTRLMLEIENFKDKLGLIHHTKMIGKGEAD